MQFELRLRRILSFSENARAFHEPENSQGEASSSSDFPAGVATDHGPRLLGKSLEAQRVTDRAPE